MFRYGRSTFFVADSSETTGLKWQAPTGATTSFTAINSGGTALTGATTITVSGFSGYNTLYIFVAGASSANASSNINLRLNTDTNAKYCQFGFQIVAGSNGNINSGNIDINTSFAGTRMGDSVTNTAASTFTVLGANSTSPKMLFHGGGGNGASTNAGNVNGGVYTGSSAITSISIVSSTGDFDAGTVFVYGA